MMSGTLGACRTTITKHPSLAAAASYIVLAALLLTPALRPGYTVVPADIVNTFAPWYQAVLHHGVASPLTSDAGLQFYPWLRFLGESLRAGHLPQWNPYILGGVPFTPNGYVTIYYPPYLLAGVFNPFFAYTLYVLLDLVIAALGTYAFARALSIRPLAAWIGGLCAFTALHWVHWSLHLNHASAMAWLPAVFAATEWTVVRPGRSSAGVLALAFALWWLGGGFQYTYYGSLALAGYALVQLIRRLRLGRRDALRSVAALAGGVVLGAVLAAPLLLPTARVAGRIVRSHDPVTVLTQSHYALRDLLLLVMPDARGNSVAGVLYRGYPYGWALDTPFVGVVALLLACAGLATLRRRHVALVIGVGLALVLAYAAWPHEVLFRLVPGYNRFRVASRWLAILPVFALPLSALGAQSLLAGAVRARRAIYGAATVAAAVIFGYDGYVASDPASPKRFFAAASAAVLLPLFALVGAVFVWRSRRALGLALVIGAILFEVGVHTGTWYPFVPTSLAYPRTDFGDRVAARGGRLIRVAPGFVQLPPFVPDVPMVYGIDDAGGQSVLFPADYDRYLRLIQDYGNWVSATNTAPPLTDPRLLQSPLVRVLDVRTAVVDPAVKMPPRYGRIADTGIQAYALHSLGAATVVPIATPVPSAAMWVSIANRRWDPSATAAVIGLPEPVRGGSGTARLVAQSDDTQRFDVIAPRGGLLRVSANYDPGWTAKIDGRPRHVYQADGIFRSVVIPPGRHDVELRYQNPYEHRGQLIALAGLLALIGLFLPWRRLLRKRRSGSSITVV
jgi:hypothetical protein